MSGHDHDDAAAALAVLFDVTTHASAAAASTLQTYDLTFTTAHLLWLTDPQEPAMSMRELAARMRCAPSNVTFLADQLEDRGLIRRARSSKDKRQRVVSLTDAGAQARSAVVSALVSSSGIGDLSPAQRRTLRQLAERMRDNQ